MSDFIHLHVASSWSLQFATHSPRDLVAMAAHHGQSALALTDRDTVAGVVSFVQACAQAGIKPIVGADIALLTPMPHLPTPMHGGRWIRHERPRVTVLARDKHGWAGLCAALSRAHAADRVNPSIDRDELMRISGEYGLTVLLGPDSDVGNSIARRRPDRALAMVNEWRERNADIYIEVVPHSEHPARTLQWAIAHRVPAVLTNMVRYADAQSARVADVLDSARLQIPLARKIHVGQAYLADTASMVEYANRIAMQVGDPRNIAQSLLHHTTALAERSVIDPAETLGLGSVFVPELSQLLPTEVRSANEVLRQRCIAELDEYLIREPTRATLAQSRLESELEVITNMGLSGYLLTVSHVVDMVRDMGIRVAARGSGAGSFVNHVLGISGVDPLAHNLLMERFISTLRPGLPDIDIDVESDRRLEVYDAIFQRFGSERVTCVSMRETYRVRHAIRDVGAALGMPPGEVDVFAKSFPHIRAGNVRGALHDLPELRRSGLAQLAARGDLEQFLDLVEKLDGLPRAVAMHPCGVVLSDLTLLQRTPVQTSAQGYSMTQFDKDDVEHMGLLKLDVLGVRMQSALAYATAEIKRTNNVDVDIDSVRLDDPKTFELIQSTRTLGCFQIESPGQRELIGKFAPVEFNDLIIDISLFRPGPVKSDMITPFLRARQGWAMTDYIHQDLRDILEETCGVVVFHEQVMRMIAALTKCSLEFADLVRRKLGDYRQLDEIREWFYRELRTHGYSLTVTEEAWTVLRAFASFGFCKAHAAAFALPTYQSAWLKAHYPAAFLAGVLTHDPGMYPKRLIVEDARNFNVPILGLDINASADTYRVELVPDLGQLGIRVSLAEVKGINSSEVASIIAGQRYTSLADFVHRASVSYPIIERLILAGAFDGLHSRQASRRDLLWHFGQLAQTRGSTVSNQLALGMSDVVWEPTPTGLKPMTISEQVKNEVEILGLDISAHMVSFYQAMLQDLGAVPAEHLLEVRSQSRVLVAGVKVATQTPPIRTGKRVIFVTVDDSTGPIDAAFFEDAQNQYATTLFSSWLLLIRGTVRRTGPRGVSISADGCWELSAVYQTWLDGGLPAVHQMLVDAPYDDTEVVIPAQVWEHASGFRQSPYADVRS